MIENEILQMPFRYPSIKIDKYIIMPNHIHLIVNIDTERQEHSPCPTSPQKVDKLARGDWQLCPQKTATVNFSGGCCFLA